MLDSSYFKLKDSKSGVEGIDLRKLIFVLWSNHHDEKLFLASLRLIRLHLSDSVKQAEFYLPQLLHCLFHIMVKYPSNDEVLSNAIIDFLGNLCAVNLHITLLVRQHFSSTLEDYEPELHDGTKNPVADNERYLLIAKILGIIDHAIISDEDALNNVETDEFTDTISPDSHGKGKTRRRRSILATNVDQLQLSQTLRSPQNKWLLYKRVQRASVISRKQWLKRYFIIQRGTLCCYATDAKDAPIKRALILSDSHVYPVNNPKHKYCFCVDQPQYGLKFQLIADDQEHMDQWIAYLKHESHSSFGLDSSANVDNENIIQRASLSEDDTIKKDIAKARKSLTSAFRFDIDGELAADSLIRHETTIDPKNGPKNDAFWRKNAQWLMTVKDSITPSAMDQFQLFSQIHSFTQNLCDICERLRFVERSHRKDSLVVEFQALRFPPAAYLLLTSSTSTYRHCESVFQYEGHPFSTRARCPVLMFFCLRPDPQRRTVGQFLMGKNADKNKSNDASESSDGIHTDKASKKSKAWKHFDNALKNVPPQNFPTCGESSSTFPKFGPSYDSSATDIPNKAYAQKIFGESMEDRRKRLGDNLRSRDLEEGSHNWELGGLIAKSNDDLRQEVFVIQIISMMQRYFREAKCSVWLRSYRILSTSKQTGLIGLIPDSVSIDSLKKNESFPGTLRLHYETLYGAPINGDRFGEYPPALDAAVTEYVRSMAGYSIICYLLLIKDRHNGNIMIDRFGHVIHIDFGFVFGIAPGKKFSLEKAHWKLTKEMVQVMGGRKSRYYTLYRDLCKEAFRIARKNAHSILSLVHLMAHESSFPSFAYDTHAAQHMKSRFLLDVPDNLIDKKVDDLIDQAYRHSGTEAYDTFQVYSNGIKK